MQLQGTAALQNLGAGTIGTVGMDRQGALLVSELNARYAGLAKAGSIFYAQAITTSMVIYSTAAGTGGPLLWNPPQSGVNIHLLAASLGITTASGVAGAIGITHGLNGVAQTAVPGSTTAIDGGIACTFPGAATSRVNAYRIGTPAAAGAALFPVWDIGTGAVSVDVQVPNWIEFAGMYCIQPGNWISLASSATLTSAVIQSVLMWAEIPV